ncbi:sulfotransferase family protein [Falsirhodobacter halotolerans]|uniref:sulfotransferase family protein n=1 Tax=Falsirhodobacter halotolerans TaxID=1146892 RepID=UPI001FD030D4|nr:sulfotransferase family protein [Falsirhodobacter halotolerans]MCJ8138364.1 sulfotransferase family protein [Falsirhodobacter halotolerans]
MTFTSFVLFAGMRTGSNFLEANLNAFDGLTCHGEVFNSGFMGKLGQTEMFGIDIAARDRDPHTVLAAMKTGEGLQGFRQFQDHDTRITQAVLDDPTCAKIILTRNPLESYVSLLIARETGQWKLTHAGKARGAKVVFNAPGFVAHVEGLGRFYADILHRLQVSGQTAFHIDYEDVQDVAVLNGLAKFLGIPARLQELDGKLKKQNPDPLADKVENPKAVEEALARLDPFQFSRVPNFEPRRGAAVPTFLAATGAPALYMPTRNGPDAQVVQWLRDLGGDVVEKMDQRALRAWRGAHPGHRSFTVLRHPLARAHTAFTDQILTNALAGIRQQMVRRYDLPLPPPGQDMGFEAHRTAFLAFLRFLKLHVAGQSGVRADAGMASQAAVLEGMGAVCQPDLILRESRLSEGLAFLAAQIDHPSPALIPAPADAAIPLSTLVDDEIEAAAREAYHRDYDQFGFGDWRDEG